MEIDTVTEASVMEEKRTTVNNVMCLLTDQDGGPIGAPMYLPQNIGPQQLQLIVNQLLNNVCILPYITLFSILCVYRLLFIFVGPASGRWNWFIGLVYSWTGLV